MKTENEKYQALGEAILSVVNPKPQEESTQETLDESLGARQSMKVIRKAFDQLEDAASDYNKAIKKSHEIIANSKKTVKEYKGEMEKDELVNVNNFLKKLIKHRDQLFGR